MISKYKVNVCFGREQLQPEQLQMLQLQKQGALHHKEGILRTHKVNSCFGREQLQMLHARGPEQLKQYRRQSHCIIKKGIFTPSYEPTKRTAAAKPEQLHVTWASAMRACQPAAQCSTYCASIVQCRRFAQRKNRVTQKISFLR